MAAAAKKVAKKTAKSAAKKPAGAAKRIMDGAREALDIVMNFDPAERRWVATPAAGQQIMTPDPVREAARKTEADVIQRRDDALVCSWLAVIDQRLSLSGLTPWLVESEIVHALGRVLDRAGYTAYGRRINDEAGENSVGKAA